MMENNDVEIMLGGYDWTNVGISCSIFVNSDVQEKKSILGAYEWLT